MSFCDSCLYPNAIASCSPCADCDALRLCGVVNETAVTSQQNLNSTLWVWRILVSNCSSHKFCDVQMQLQPNWKFAVTQIFQNNWVQQIANPVLVHYNIQTNIPGATPVSAPLGWNGLFPNDFLFVTPFMLPPGQFVVQVSLEVANSAMPNDCPHPTLFPSLVTLTGTDASHGCCPVSTATLIGCHPENVVVDLTP